MLAIFEPRFGYDLSGVRIHDDRSADASAHAVGALAYASGREIIFASGQFAPETASGRKLLAHELTHVIQQDGVPVMQTAAGGHHIPPIIPMRSTKNIQRNVVPRAEFERLVEEIDQKLQAPDKLSEADKTELLRKRHEYYRQISDDQSTQAAGSAVPAQASVSFQNTENRSGRGASSIQTAHPSVRPTLKTVPSTGTPGSKGASATNAVSREAKKGSTPPPSKSYENTNPKATDVENGIGAKLNQLAVGRELGDTRKVEGRPESAKGTSDYIFIQKDGTEIKADLYSPETVKSADDLARAVGRSKSSQAEIAIVELPGRGGLELAQQTAESLIVTPNHTIKRAIFLVNGNVVLDRKLTVDAKGLAKIQARVNARLTAQAKAEPSDAQVKAEVTKIEPSKVDAIGLDDSARVESTNGKGLTTNAETGLPDAPFDPQATTERALDPPTGTKMNNQSAMAGAAQMILSAQLSQQRNTQYAAFAKRLRELQPQIDELRASGHWVKLRGVLQIPDVIDVAAMPAGVGDVTQVVKFVSLGIEPSLDTVGKFDDQTRMSVPEDAVSPKPDPGWHLWWGVVRVYPPLTKFKMP